MAVSGGGNKYTGMTTMAGQPFEVIVSSGSLSWSKTGGDQPIICDGTSTLGLTPGTGGGTGGGSSPGTGGSSQTTGDAGGGNGQEGDDPPAILTFVAILSDVTINTFDRASYTVLLSFMIKNETGVWPLDVVLDVTCCSAAGCHAPPPPAPPPQPLSACCQPGSQAWINGEYDTMTCSVMCTLAECIECDEWRSDCDCSSSEPWERCSTGCIFRDVGNGICDPECNVPACNNDCDESGRTCDCDDSTSGSASASPPPLPSPPSSGVRVEATITMPSLENAKTAAASLEAIPLSKLSVWLGVTVSSAQAETIVVGQFAVGQEVDDSKYASPSGGSVIVVIIVVAILVIICAICACRAFCTCCRRSLSPPHSSATASTQTQSAPRDSQGCCTSLFAWLTIHPLQAAFAWLNDGEDTYWQGDPRGWFNNKLTSIFKRWALLLTAISVMGELASTSIQPNAYYCPPDCAVLREGLLFGSLLLENLLSETLFPCDPQIGVTSTTEFSTDMELTSVRVLLTTPDYIDYCPGNGVPVQSIERSRIFFFFTGDVATAYTTASIFFSLVWLVLRIASMTFSKDDQLCMSPCCCG